MTSSAGVGNAFSGRRWGIDAYQADQPAKGKEIMIHLIKTLASGLPAGPEHLRDTAREFRSIVNYIARYAAGFRPQIHSLL